MRMISILEIVHDTMVDGPGFRTSIYCAGCPNACSGCHNPQSWDIRHGTLMTTAAIMREIVSDPFANVTFTGGDPIEQFDELMELIKLLKSITDDILVYTGEYFVDLNEEKQHKIKKNIAVLIDGPYIHELNFKHINLRGSKNQNILYFNKKLKYKYKENTKKGRMIQNVMMGEKLISVGIHNRQEENHDR